MAAALVCFGAFVLEGADVQCIWNGNTYVCSGTGSSIEVIGGGSGLPVVVTNFWGVCTNCVAMSPSYCESFKGTLKDAFLELSQEFDGFVFEAGSVVSNIQVRLDDIGTFQKIGTLPDLPVSQNVIAFSNYIYTVDNTQTSLVRSQVKGNTSITHWRYLGSYSNGIYDYAQTIAQSLEYQKERVGMIRKFASDGSERAKSLGDDLSNRLNCEECQAEYEPGPDPGGSGISTNGNWCTFDQGEAIKGLLNQLNLWLENAHSQLERISEFAEQSFNTMRDGLFTSYTHIPTEEDLGMHWQELYLEGYSPNFHEYASTNILARIELLLAGMSGVLTNSSDFAEAASFAEEGMEPTNELKTVAADFTNEFANVIQEREANVRSVGDALVGLYNSFRGWSGTPFSRTTLIGSYSFEIGEQHWDVPSFEPSEQGLWVGNLIRVVCRSVMSVLYILFTVAVFIRFHIAFFQWVLKYLKWGVELMQGLFA